MDCIHTIVLCSVIFVSASSVVHCSCVKNIKCICYTENILGEHLLVANCAYLNLTYVPEFIGSVQWIDLSSNNLTGFNGTLPAHLRGLNVSNNPLETLSVPSFIRLGALRALIIRNTSLNFSALPEGVFRGMKRLNYLDIKHSNTDQTGFPFPEYESLGSLHSLLIDGYPGVFGPKMKKFASLRYLDLSGVTGSCNISFIDEMFFQFVENITYLDLSGCQLQTIFAGSLSKYENLRYLDISHNKELSFAILENLTNELKYTDIETLKLNEIHCTHGLGTVLLQSDVINLQNTSLKSFSLESNRLELIENGAVLSFPKSIEFISIADNKLAAGQYVNYVSVLSRLKVIDCSDQQRTVFPTNSDYSNCEDKSNRCERNSSAYQGHRSLEYKEVYQDSYTHIYDIGLNESSCLSIPESLERVIYIESKLKIEIPKLSLCKNNAKNIFLQNNVFYSWKGPIENVPHVKTLNLSNNFCSYVSTYFFDNFLNLTDLDVSENFLGYSLQKDAKGLIFKGLRRLQRIQLSSNRISILPEQVFQHLIGLQILNMSYNLLTSLDVDFSPLKFISVVDLSYNQLPTIAAEHQAFFTRHGKDLEVNLTGNPLVCNCDDIEFWKWLDESTFVQLSEENVCNNGKYKEIFNDNTTSFHDAVLIMKKDCANYTALKVGLACGTILFAVLLMTSLVYRYRWKLRFLYYTTKIRYFGYTNLRAGEENADYLYDCFISYADRDRQFALHEMRQNLESESDLSLCFHQRDFIPGIDIAENITSAIRDSRKTICILSPNFLESYWCMYELNMARMESIYSRKSGNIAILVLYKAVNPGKLPLSLLSLIESQSYLDYPDDEQGKVAFWIKLKEAIRV